MSSTKAVKQGPAQRFQSALSLLNQGQIDAAIEVLKELSNQYPSHIDTLDALGVAYYRAQKPAEAVDCLKRAIQLAPKTALLYHHLGPALRALCRYDDAILTYQKALELSPNEAETLNNFANLYRDLGQFDLAIQYYRCALESQPTNPVYHYNLGGTLSESGNLLEAKKSFENAIRLRPDYADAYNDLGKVYRHAGRLAPASECYQRAIEINPKHVLALNNLAGIFKIHGQTADAIEYYERALAVKPDYADAYSNMLFAMQYSERVDTREMFQAHLNYAVRFERGLKKNWVRHTNCLDSERKLKVGYISADFNHHAVAYFITPVLASHDKDKFEVFAYYNGTRRDQFTDHIIDAVNHFKFVKPYSDEQLAEQIRIDEIDILVDLSGHTAGNRLLVFARKTAPIQVTWLGYFGTSGLEAMDYRFTDAFMDPPGFADEIHTESLVRLPHFSPFKPHVNSPDINVLPVLSSGRFTFASMNNLAKLNERVIELWSRILKAIPNSVLYLCNVGDAKTEDIVLNKFERHGISKTRLFLQAWMPMEDYLALHHEIDLALDPFPYNGGTITNHSLWMGVPVITLASDRSVGRIGASLMNRVNLPEMIAHTEQEYVDIAINFSQDLQRLNQLRTGMRQRLDVNLDASILTLTKSVESEYSAMWRKWCASQNALGNSP